MCDTTVQASRKDGDSQIEVVYVLKADIELKWMKNPPASVPDVGCSCVK